MVTDNGQWGTSGRPSATAARHVQPGGFSQPLLWHKRDPEANPRYKTQLCSHFMADGRCPYGSSCVYAHGEHERRELTPHALALRAQRQRQREEQQSRRRPPLDKTADANTHTSLVTGLADPFRPSVCSPRPTDAPSNAPGKLFWSSPSDLSKIWAPPDQPTQADDEAAGGPEGVDSTCGIDLARMTSALLTGGDDSPAPAQEAEASGAPLAARMQQLASMAHLHASGLLSQAELTNKVIALADPTAQRERGQLKSLVHLFATGCFSQAELTAKARSILTPICSMGDETTETPDETSASAKSDVFSGSDDEKTGEEQFGELTKDAQFDMIATALESHDDSRQLAIQLATNPALAGTVRHGRTLLQLAAKSGRAACISELTPLMEQAQLDRRTKVKAASNGKVSGGYTALHYAAYNGHRAAAKSLLEGGADPNVQNAAGETAALTAAIRSHGIVASLLKAAGSTKPTRLKNGMIASGPNGPGFQSHRSKWSRSSDLGSDFAKARQQPISA